MSRIRKFLIDCGSSTPSEPSSSHDEVLGLDNGQLQMHLFHLINVSLLVELETGKMFRILRKFLCTSSEQMKSLLGAQRPDIRRESHGVQKPQMPEAITRGWPSLCSLVLLLFPPRSLLLMLLMVKLQMFSGSQRQTQCSNLTLEKISRC